MYALWRASTCRSDFHLISINFKIILMQQKFKLGSIGREFQTSRFLAFSECVILREFLHASLKSY